MIGLLIRPGFSIPPLLDPSLELLDSIPLNKTNIPPEHPHEESLRKNNTNKYNSTINANNSSKNIYSPPRIPNNSIPYNNTQWIPVMKSTSNISAIQTMNSNNQPIGGSNLGRYYQSTDDVAIRSDSEKGEGEGEEAPMESNSNDMNPTPVELFLSPSSGTNIPNSQNDFDNNANTNSNDSNEESNYDMKLDSNSLLDSPPTTKKPTLPSNKPREVIELLSPSQDDSPNNSSNNTYSLEETTHSLNEDERRDNNLQRREQHQRRTGSSSLTVIRISNRIIYLSRISNRSLPIPDNVFLLVLSIYLLLGFAYSNIFTNHSRNNHPYIINTIQFIYITQFCPFSYYPARKIYYHNSRKESSSTQLDYR